MNAEVTIIGFPKCGTSALVGCFESDSEMQMLRTPSGAREVTWPMIKDIRPQPDPNRILAHKYTAYVYSQTALEYLVNVNPRNLIVLCIRTPIRALASWHHMHRKIAHTGRNLEHFAWKERDFYAECSLSDYYGRFAEDRIKYDMHLNSVLSVVPKERLVVVSQERMAQDIRSVAKCLKVLARNELGIASEQTANAGPRHVGYADTATIELDDSIRKELEAVRRRLAIIVDKELIHKLI